MKNRGYACFVRRPRNIGELRRPYPVERERPYEIGKRIRLTKTEYDNFAADLLADRQFIEDNRAFCSGGTPFRCLLVQARSAGDGILVIPEGTCYVGYAAYYCGTMSG